MTQFGLSLVGFIGDAQSIDTADLTSVGSAFFVLRTASQSIDPSPLHGPP